MENIQAWALALIVYPGVLFGVLLALLIEWTYQLFSQFWARAGRMQSRLRPLFYPLLNLLKLAGRRYNAVPTLHERNELAEAKKLPASTQAPMPNRSGVDSLISAACAVAPLLALVVLPLPASPLLATGQSADLLLAVPLLLLQPLGAALLGLRAGGLASLRGARDLGRLLTGLLPALIAVAALIEVAGTSSLRLAALTSAPETGAQTLVRFLSGAVLLLALPCWRHSDDGVANRGGAGLYAGQLIQAVALAAFWSLLVLPAPGDQVWALVLYVVSILIASIAMRLISERLLPVRRERDRANLVWATALPVAVVALLVSFWWGGL